jgi:hypothetical protein
MNIVVPAATSNHGIPFPFYDIPLARDRRLTYQANHRLIG